MKNKNQRGSSVRTQWNRLEMRNGMLHRKWVLHNGWRITWQIVVPESLRKEVLKLLHDSPSAGQNTRKVLLGWILQVP